MNHSIRDGLLNPEEAPGWFAYPEEFLRIYDQGLINFQPWTVLEGDWLRTRFQGLKNRYQSRQPCFEKDVPGVVIIHDHASQGWESRPGYDSFWDWLRAALEETILWE